MSPIEGERTPRRGAVALPNPTWWSDLRAAALALMLVGCGAVGPPAANSGTYQPPPRLSLVAIVDPSGDQVATELGELTQVVEASVTPSETLVVSTPSRGALATTYLVRKGDSLDSIAGAQGVSLGVLEDANPQLGPIAGRDWNRIYPGDGVTIPDRQPGTPTPSPRPVKTRPFAFGKWRTAATTRGGALMAAARFPSVSRAMAGLSRLVETMCPRFGTRMARPLP